MRRSCKSVAPFVAAAVVLIGCMRAAVSRDSAAAPSSGGGWAVAAAEAGAKDVTETLAVAGREQQEPPGGVSMGGSANSAEEVAGSDVSSPPSPSIDAMKISVVGAGLSRTGTVSTVQALDRLGFQTYHMKDMFAIPGHFDLWHQYYFPEEAETKTRTTLDDVMERIEQDGFNATMDEPTNLHFAELLERYPDAKVILNLRKGGGKVWADSFLASVHPIPYLMDRPPFSWSTTIAKQSQLLHRIYRELGVSNDPQLTQDERRDRMADMYERWVEHVRSKVPAAQLLEFHVQDGWEPLCSFLAHATPQVDEACREISQLNEPFPHANDGNFVRRLVAIMRAMCALVEALPVLAVVAAAVGGGLWYLRRGKRPIPSKHKVL